MTQSIPAIHQTKLSFEDYLDYEEEPDVRHELWHGRLIEMPTATLLHSRICQFLLYTFQQIIAASELDLVCMTNVAVRTDEDTVRIPDILVCPRSLWLTIQDRPRAGVLNFDETPSLVVEVTSTNWRDDYVLKMGEYAYNNIPEYWIVDPRKQHFWLMSHPEGEFGYSRTEFSASELIESPLLPNLNLTVAQALSPPTVESLIAEQQTRNRQQIVKANQVAEQEKQRAEQEKQRAEQEKQRAEQEKQRAEQEKQRAEQEKQRAERESQKSMQMADKLRELGVNPETLS